MVGRFILASTARRGFTIVELLIVIVVIAILAAITIVSYNGIQKRATSVSYSAMVDGLEKQVRLALIEDKLKNFDTNNLFICAGMESDFPAGDGLADKQCSTTSNYLINPDSPVYADNALATILKQAGIQLPGKLTIAKRAGFGTSGTIVARGIQVYGTSTSVNLWWYPPDTTSCGRGTNETEAFITFVKNSPSALASYQNQFGANWEQAVRDGIGGWCSLAIVK